jgi:hypothetical protein
MTKLLSALCLSVGLSVGAQQPIMRNPWSTNVAGTPVQGADNLSVTNSGSGTNWQFHGTGPATVARLGDVHSLSTNVTIWGGGAGDTGLVVRAFNGMQVQAISGAVDAWIGKGPAYQSIFYGDVAITPGGGGGMFIGNGWGLTNLNIAGGSTNGGDVLRKDFPLTQFDTNATTVAIKSGALVTNLQVFDRLRFINMNAMCPGALYLTNVAGSPSDYLSVWSTNLDGPVIRFVTDGSIILSYSPTITNFENSIHGHSNNASGGAFTAYLAADITTSNGVINYANSAGAFGQTWYVWGSSNSVVTNSLGTNYKVMQRADVPMTTTIVTNAYVNPANADYIGSVITAIPCGLGDLKPGNYISASYIWRTSGGGDAVTLTPEYYIRTNLLFNGGEREIAVGNPITIDATPKEWLQSVQITTNVVLSPTNYLVRKYKVSGKGGTPTVYFSSQGGRPAYITVPIPSSAFVLKSGDTMSGDLTVNGILTVTGTVANYVEMGGGLSVAGAITNSRLTAARALVSVVDGGPTIITNSHVTTTQLGYLAGAPLESLSTNNAGSLTNLTGTNIINIWQTWPGPVTNINLINGYKYYVAAANCGVTGMVGTVTAEARWVTLTVSNNTAGVIYLTNTILGARPVGVATTNLLVIPSYKVGTLSILNMAGTTQYGTAAEQ